MNPDNSGSFGIGLGGVESLKAAMQRRGIDASVLDQTSPAAPGAESPVPPNLPAQAGPLPGPTDQQVATQAVGGAVVAPTGLELPNEGFRSQEMSIALRAMDGVIKTENEIVKSALKLQGLR